MATREYGSLLHVIRERVIHVVCAAGVLLFLLDSGGERARCYHIELLETVRGFFRGEQTFVRVALELEFKNVLKNKINVKFYLLVNVCEKLFVVESHLFDLFKMLFKPI